MNEYLFPIALMLCDIGAAITYGINGDLHKVIYLDCGSSFNRCGDILGGRTNDGRI